MAGNGSVGGLRGPFADHHLRRDEGLASAGASGAGRAPRAQAGGQFPMQGAASLNVERLMDRLTADPHRLVLGSVELQSARDLLGAPGPGPSSGLAPSMSAPFPGDAGAFYRFHRPAA